MVEMEKNLYLIQSVLQRHYKGGHYTAQRLGIEVDDLYQVGCIGLLKAYKNYDVAKSNGAKFETYASMKIYREIQYYCVHQGHSIKYPARIRRMASKIFTINEEITMDSIMRELNLDPQTATDMYLYIQNKKNDISLDDSPQMEQSIKSFHEVIPDLFILEGMVHEKIDLEQRLAILSSRERSICNMMLKGKTQAEISHILGVQQSSVSRIIKRSVQKIQKQFA